MFALVLVAALTLCPDNPDNHYWPNCIIVQTSS